ncbi:hypothetical protein TIFTF001_003119 [Ficus carica]|uniref:phosphatidylserine decarboxylase n=1 Tax=Ficus carica TaxID=3494 RepID=A0AA87ZQI5_FICCA|nr:hypothetical protein TIFTF001_003119 [Ficus carica]
MKFRVSHRVPVFPHFAHANYLHNQRRSVSSFVKHLRAATQARASFNGGSGSSQGDTFLVPGATVATLLMLGALHGRRMYDDKKVEEARERGIESEFQPDFKKAKIYAHWIKPKEHLRNRGLFSISDLEEAALSLSEYATLREFFVRALKEGCRPIDPDPHCLVSPVDGIILRFGEIRGPGAMIDQVKGFSYSVSALLGASSFIPMIAEGDTDEDGDEPENTSMDKSKKSWWRVSLSSPKIWDPVSSRPGDYHRIHSPVDWNIFIRRHFSGLDKEKSNSAGYRILCNLFPVNERAARTIRNLYVQNERVVLEGLWQEGFMAIAAIGATNIGSIELPMEPKFRTNLPRKKSLHPQTPEERLYEPEGVGLTLRKGDEIAVFNMGSTVVMVFQAPVKIGDSSSEFKFSIKCGDKISVGEALGSFKDCQCENCCQHAFQHVVKNHANGEESCLVATQGITVHDSHNDILCLKKK